MMQISPRFKSWEKAIEIFEGRFLKMVELIMDVEFSGFAALALDCLLIETLQQFIEGVDETPRGKGKQYFQRFLIAAPFDGRFDMASAGIFYEQFRCGILHQAEIKGSSRVWKVGAMVQFTADGKGLIGNHQILHAKMRTALDSYLGTPSGERPDAPKEFQEEDRLHLSGAADSPIDEWIGFRMSAWSLHSVAGLDMLPLCFADNEQS
jgi:hypothetical protein